jgi:isopenicillin-N epimerase
MVPHAITSEEWQAFETTSGHDNGSHGSYARRSMDRQTTIEPAGEESFDRASLFALDPSVTHLNHGSFGACPRVVLAHQAELRARMERDTMRFFIRERPPLLEDARARVATFVGARPEDVVFTANASSSISAVLRSIDLREGDELLTTNHAYNACKNALHYVADRAGAVVRVANIPLPIADEDAIVEPILRAVTPKTKLALIDHVTSQTAIVFPIARIVRELDARGVDTLVDGAHAIGMLPLNLSAIGAAYYTANAHKWLCAPKTVAVLAVRADRQDRLAPLSISHGFNDASVGRSRFHKVFDWTGTTDPTAALSIPHAIDFLTSCWPGGLDVLRARNRALALRARDHLLGMVGGAAIADPSLLGSMASISIGPSVTQSRSALDEDPLQSGLGAEGIEVPVFSFGAARLLRVSCQAYTRWSDIERLGRALIEHGIASSP